MKLPWQRNNQSSSLPPEVQQYYAGSPKQRKSVAWMLAFSTLVTTVVIALGAFFVSRWVYRKIVGTSNKPTTVVTQPVGQDNKPEPAKPTPKPSKKKSTTTTASASNLAETGPGGTLAAFIITTVLGTAAYELKLRRKTY
ncbi:hypothetical protein A3J32_01965 [Candidatus Saccharibacteria bacterium RIFCSPLOWO2_02_FULL_46_7]|nr:MAG: hypothetical protein A3J32_01965 [Candidatus Saccharibacteria bacterium RIFCSPLOWO2_02_FULL_46_7]